MKEKVPRPGIDLRNLIVQYEPNLLALLAEIELLYLGLA